MYKHKIIDLRDLKSLEAIEKELNSLSLDGWQIALTFGKHNRFLILVQEK